MSATSGMDRSTPRQTVDDRICAVLRVLRQVAEEDLGFRREGNRADGERELHAGSGAHALRIKFDTHFVHREGRVILAVREGRGAWNRREIRITGTTSYSDELERCTKTLLNIVRRALVRARPYDLNGAAENGTEGVA